MMSVQAAEATAARVNGVDVGAVKSTVGAIEETPDLAKSKFRAHRCWSGKSP